MKTSFENFNKIVQMLTNYVNHCPKCSSSNIANEDESDMITCHDCSHQFDTEDYLDKVHVEAYLRSKNEIEAADFFAQMSLKEYNQFIDEYLSDFDE